MNALSQIGIIGSTSNWSLAIPVVLSDTPTNCSSPTLVGASTNAAVIAASQIAFSGAYPHCVMTLSIAGGMIGYTTLTVTAALGTATAWQNLDLYILAPPTTTFALWDAVEGYVGNLINLRRSTDNSMSDIGFNTSTGNLNTAALTTFENGGSGYIDLWYDQSGAGDNALQPINANQPQISTGINFNGTTDSLSLSSLFSTLTSFAVETWVNATSPSTAGSMIVTNAEGTATMNGFQLRQSTAPPNRVEFVVGQKFYSYRDYVLSLQPVRYFRLNETSGTTAYDLSSQAANGTYTNSSGYILNQPGALIASGDNDSAASFSGTGYVTGSDTGLPSGNSARSASAWINAPAPASGSVSVIYNWGSPTTDQAYGLAIVNSSGTYSLLNFGWSDDALMNFTFTPNTWIHVASTYDGTTARVYLNGVLLGTSPRPNWNTVLNSLVIARDISSSTNDPFTGRIDEVAIFNYVLSATQISNLYHQGNSVYQNVILADLPILYYRFGEAPGSPSAVDLSGNGNTGAYQNSPTLGASGSGALVDDSDTAVTLDGSSQYISTTSQYTHPQTISEEIWFKTVIGYSSGGKLVGFGSSQTGSSSGYDCHIWMDSGGLIRYGVQSSGGPLFSIVSPTAYNDGNWHHAVGTFTANSWLLYLDSILVASSTAIAALANYSGYWRFGYDNFTAWTDAPSSSYFQGTLDEGAIYNYVLTPTQVTNHFRAGTPYRALVIQDKPVGYWRLNESSGTTAYDLSGNGNNGTYTGGYTLGQMGALIASGDNDSSVLLDGSTATITVPTSTTLGGTAISVGAWIKTTYSGGERDIIYKGYSNYQLMMTSGKIYICSNGVCCLAISSVTVNDGNFHHVVGVINGTSGQVYVDGVNRTSGQSNCSIASNTSALSLGSINGSNAFPGTLDEVVIFNTALSGAQILDLYQTGTSTHKDGVPYPGNAILAANPIGYWRLGEKSGQIAYDYSGNGNNGTYVGGVTLGQPGAVAGVGDSDSSVLLNGTSGSVSTSITGGIPAAHSVTMWINPSTVSSNLNMYLMATGGGNNNWFQLYDGHGSGHLTTRMGSSGSGVGGYFDGNFQYNTANIWYFVAITITSANLATIYVNGVQDAQTTLTIINAPNNSVTFGSVGSGSYFNGIMDEVAIFNYPLSSTQISTLYNTGNGAPWWYCQSQSQLSSSYWNLLTGIYNGTTAQLFMNGQQECSVIPATQYSGSLATTTVGATSALTNFWNGVMSYLSLFGSTSTPTTAVNVYTDFGGTANRFRTVPIENTVTTNLVAHFDAANAQLGISAYANGCPTSALSWFDLSPNANNATLLNFSSCSLTSGWYNSGSASGPFYLAFNGSNNYANTAFTTSYSTYTFETWTKLASAVANAAVISSAGSATTFLNLGSTPYPWQFNSAIAVTAAATSQWTHVVGVQNGSTQTLYVNGAQAATASGSSSVSAIDIGRRGDGIYFNGDIGVARIYSTALTLQQVKQNCNAQQARFGVTNCVYP